MNMFGFIQFSKEIIASGVANRTGKEVRLGRINWQADSYHIYGRDIEKAKAMLFERLDTMDFEERIFNFNDQFIRDMYDAAEESVQKKIAKYDSEHKP